MIIVKQKSRRAAQVLKCELIFINTYNKSAGKYVHQMLRPEGVDSFCITAALTAGDIINVMNIMEGISSVGV